MIAHTPGGGGWGDPLQRQPELVLRDVRDGVVSPEAARRLYGVVIDTDRWAIDSVATGTIRGEGNPTC
jgi:N-methylhydantoinase B